MADEFYFDTPRLRLRPLRPADAPAVAAYEAAPGYTRFLNQRTPRDEAEARELFARSEAMFARGEAFYFALVARAESRVVGTLGIRFPVHHRLANLGYGLDPACGGRGLMTEAVTAACALAFGDLHAARVDATVQAGNRASARVLEKCGFSRDAHLRGNRLVAGDWVDEWVFTWLRAEWEAAERPGESRRRGGPLGPQPRAAPPGPGRS